MIITNRPQLDERQCCVIDFDGVVYDLMYSVEIYLHTHEGLHFKRENVLTYDFNKSLDDTFCKGEFIDIPTSLGVSRDRIFSAMADPEVYAFDTYCSGVKEAIENVSDIVPVVIYSYCLSDDMVYAKAKLFESCFGGMPNVYYCVTSDRVKDTYPNALYVVEDSIENLDKYILDNNIAVSGIGTGLYLVDQSYNQELYNQRYASSLKHFVRVSSCVDALERICASYYIVNACLEV